MTWTKWSDARPTDHSLACRWRVSERKILGMMLQPEWTEKLRLVGMGLADNEWWPPYSNWDGYQRSVDPTLEWRPAADDEAPIYFDGLDLLPCPFTGRAPRIVTLGRWIGSPPYILDWIGIESHMVKSLGWTDAAAMAAAWNTRAIAAR